MTVTLKLDPDVEKGLIARARERGVSLDAYLQEIVAREAGVSRSPSLIEARNLSDLLLKSPFYGADLNLERPRDYARPTELE
jgi:hypothetical protein